jgi:tetratricopeptide (TPR) repeat protein
MPTQSGRQRIHEIAQQALAAAEAGHFDEAVRLYASVARQDEGRVLTWLRLGATAFAQQEYAYAERWFRAAHKAAPGEAAPLSNLGAALRAQGRLDEAMAAYRRAIAANPDYAEAHYNLGNALRALDRQAESVPCYEAALRLQPLYPPCWNNLGNTLKALGRFDEAEACFRRALEQQPDFLSAWNNLGNVCTELGRLDEAQQCLEHVLSYEAADGRLLGLGQAGVAHQEAGQPQEAARCYETLLEENPEFVPALVNLGVLRQAQGDFTAADAPLTEARSLRPGYAEAHYNLGLVRCAQGRFAEAIECHETALALQPGHHAARFARGIARLMAGDLENGLPDYESRWLGEKPPREEPRLPVPGCIRWRGEAVGDDAVIFIHPEQGLGDNLQCARYLPLLAQRFARVIYPCTETLHRLLRNSLDDPRVLIEPERWREVGRITHECPRLSLPLAFGTRLDTIPGSVPYLRALDTDVVHWAARLATQDGLKVGLVWAGGKALKRDHLRSLPLAAFTLLFEVPGIRWVSLQHGPEAAQIKARGLPLSDWMSEVRDMADTAALIMNLDLVISVDTAVAHLAAALGKPVWLLNRYESEWRWLYGRTDSPWYPSMRLFNQTRPTDWAETIAELRAALAREGGRERG